jgi:hypothetical protein
MAIRRFFFAKSRLLGYGQLLMRSTALGQSLDKHQAAA